MQQLCKSMGRYEDLAASKIRQSLGCSNDEGKLRGGTGRRASLLAMSECILCLDQAADLYGQVGQAPHLTAACDLWDAPWVGSIKDPGGGGVCGSSGSAVI